MDTELGSPRLDFSKITAYMVGSAKRLWPREADDFVPWLVANLDLLGGQLGLALTFVGTEVPVGDLRADLVAQDASGRRVIVEAQYGPSDHKHLGQLMTYACAGDADVLVWVIVADDPFRPLLRNEHLATLAELNARFVGAREFHAVEVTLESEPQRFGDPIRDLPLLPRLRLRNSARKGPQRTPRSPGAEQTGWSE